jgi:hypothetical protein
MITGWGCCPTAATSKSKASEAVASTLFMPKNLPEDEQRYELDGLSLLKLFLCSS